MAWNSGLLTEADALFIEGVKQNSILYNPSTADFRLSYKKEKTWEDLAASMGIAPSDAKRRWTSLRERYSRELRQLRLKTPKRSNCGNNDFFRQMDFLRPFVKKREGRRNPWKNKDANESGKIKLLSEDTIVSFYEDTEDQYSNKLESTVPEEDYNLIGCELDPLEPYEQYATDEQNFTTKPKTVPGEQQKGFKNEVPPAMLSPMSENVNMLNSTIIQQHRLKNDSKFTEVPPHQENEDDFFCKSVAMYLKKLSRKHKIKAKVEMFQILEKYIEIEESATTVADQHRRDGQRH